MLKIAWPPANEYLPLNCKHEDLTVYLHTVYETAQLIGDVHICILGTIAMNHIIGSI